MTKRYDLFKDGGVPKSYLEANWIERRQILRAEVLALPAKSRKKLALRKTIDVGGRILTLVLLSMVDKTKEDRAAAAKLRASLRIKRGKDSKKLTLSKTAALKWASFAATLGLMPLPDGQI
ncbi:hypothetical protein H257_19503, partial [Aphanomyces astaci]